MILFKISGHLKAGLDTIRGSKVRSFWTMLGITIGVASFITIVAIGEGVKQQIGGQIHSYGPNIISVRATSLKFGSGNGANNSSFSSLTSLSVYSPLTLKDINTVSHVYGVGQSSPLSLVSGNVSGSNGVYRSGFVLGASPSLPSLLNQSLAFGTFFGSTSSATGNVAVIGEQLAESMFNEDVPLGQNISFRGQDFIVEGIFNQFNSEPLSDQANLNDAVFIPNSIAESLTNNTAPTYEILARAKNTAQTSLVANNIRSALNSNHGGYSGFSVQTGNQNLDQNNNILTLLTDLVAGVAAISLLVAGLGIMNVMLVSVSERVREIGIRKAIGATNQQVLSQFIVESSVLTLTGGIIGILLSFLVDLLLRLLTNLRPIISWQIVLIAGVVSLLVGIIFGTVPAVKAARKDPIDALRAE